MTYCIEVLSVIDLEKITPLQAIFEKKASFRCGVDDAKIPRHASNMDRRGHISIIFCMIYNLHILISYNSIIYSLVSRCAGQCGPRELRDYHEGPIPAGRPTCSLLKP